MKDITGIFFDVGDTLVYPLEGAWFPGACFAAVLAAHGIEALQPERLRLGMEKGMDYLNAHHFLETEAEEKEQFRRYYSILLETANVAGVSEAIIEELAEKRVEASEWGLYPDTKPALERLQRRGYLLGIISDTWPSFDRRLRACDLRRFFSGPIVISARSGCFKPDRRIFRIALEQSGLEARQLVFLDNFLENVMAAVHLGMNGVLIARSGGLPDAPVPVVQTLEQFESLL